MGLNSGHVSRLESAFANQLPVGFGRRRSQGLGKHFSLSNQIPGGAAKEQGQFQGFTLDRWNRKNPLDTSAGLGRVGNQGGVWSLGQVERGLDQMSGGQWGHGGA